MGTHGRSPAREALPELVREVPRRGRCPGRGSTFASPREGGPLWRLQVTRGGCAGADSRAEGA